MVYRVQAYLRFASNGQRTAGRGSIVSAMAGKNMAVVADRDRSRFGEFQVTWEATTSNAGDADAVYALVQALTTPLPGSFVRYHTCFHGDNTAGCLVTAQKDW